LLIKVLRQCYFIHIAAGFLSGSGVIGRLASAYQEAAAAAGPEAKTIKEPTGSALFLQPPFRLLKSARSFETGFIFPALQSELSGVLA
jgi:hypothetical protein